jgi:hypothetical protein
VFKSGFVKRNGKKSETKRNGMKRKCQGHETKRNETERNFCETIKTKRKENRITFLIRFKF